jgi:hypothetical protein
MDAHHQHTVTEHACIVTEHVSTGYGGFPEPPLLLPPSTRYLQMLHLPLLLLPRCPSRSPW